MKIITHISYLHFLFLWLKHQKEVYYLVSSGFALPFSVWWWLKCGWTETSHVQVSDQHQTQLCPSACNPTQFFRIRTEYVKPTMFLASDQKRTLCTRWECLQHVLLFTISCNKRKQDMRSVLTLLKFQALIESAGCYAFINKNVGIFCLTFWIQVKRIWSYYMSLINNMTNTSLNLLQPDISYSPSRLAVLLGYLPKHFVYTNR